MTGYKSRKRWNPRKPPTSTPPVGGFTKRQILTGNESEFHRLLVESAGSEYQVFPKVGLKDVIKQTDQRDFSRIQSKHVDFIIAGNNGRTTIAAIELDDASHDDRSNALHDAAKDFFLNSAGIPVIRIRRKEAQSLTPAQLRGIYLSAKADPNCKYPVTDRKKGCAEVLALLLLLLLTLLFLWIF